MLMKNFLFILLFLGCSQALFVPEQLTTLLSFIYTNIPPIRKGTDSRVGFGFRLGPNADFQVTLELGPQENTIPLGPQGNSKRETYNEEDNKDWGANLEMLQQQDTGGGPVPQVDEDVINHLRQLYKPQKKAS